MRRSVVDDGIWLEVESNKIEYGDVAIIELHLLIQDWRKGFVFVLIDDSTDGFCGHCAYKIEVAVLPSGPSRWKKRSE